MIRDLLNPASGFLDLREDSKGVIQVAGITEVSTINAQEVGRPPNVLFSPAELTAPHLIREHRLVWAMMIFFFISLYLDHGATGERQQAAHSGANSSQSDVITLARRAAGGRQAAKPLS